MSSRMNVSTVFDLDSFGDVLDKSPELALDIVFVDEPSFVENRIEGHLVCEMVLLESVCSFLERSKGVHLAFFKSELSCTDKTPGTVPVVFRLLHLYRRLETCAVVTTIATITYQK